MISDDIWARIKVCSTMNALPRSTSGSPTLYEPPHVSSPPPQGLPQTPTTADELTHTARLLRPYRPRAFPQPLPNTPPACDLRRSPPFPDACTPGFQGHQGHPSTTTPADEPLTHSALLPNPRPTILSLPPQAPLPLHSPVPLHPPRPSPLHPLPQWPSLLSPEDHRQVTFTWKSQVTAPPLNARGGGLAFVRCQVPSSWSSGAEKKKYE